MGGVVDKSAFGGCAADGPVGGGVVKSAFGGWAADGPDVLSVASSHGGDFRVDINELPAPVLLCRAAALANRERYLVARTPFVAGSSENVPRQEEQRGIVIESLARFPPHLPERFPERREHFAGHLEPQHMPLRPWVGRIIGPIPRPPSRNQLLDLPHGLSARHLQPVTFGIASGDSRELPDYGVLSSSCVPAQPGEARTPRGLLKTPRDPLRTSSIDPTWQHAR
ncbi:MAG TPA: hypothetical protein VGK73_38825, partial [Polyangiaceae bacterium]